MFHRGRRPRRLDGIDLAVLVGGATGGLDRLQEAGPGRGRVHDGAAGAARDAVVVLHLLDADDVGRPEVVHDQLGEVVVLGLWIGAGEVLDVEGRHRHPWSVVGAVVSRTSPPDENRGVEVAWIL